MSQIISNGLDFNDLLIIPEVLSNIDSRYNDIYPMNSVGSYPLFTAPMDSVVDLNNVDHYLNNNISVVLPRTINLIEFFKIKEKSDKLDNVFISLGINEFEYLVNNKFISYNAIFPKGIFSHNNILIDVANGHMNKILRLCTEAKALQNELNIMVGNIANPETYKKYAETKSIYGIRVGIGAGAGCLTSENVSIGYASASLIHETYQIKKNLSLSGYKFNELPLIIADGGMKNYSDIITALALGADFVMVGSIFNKAIESSGSNYWHGFKINPRTAKFLFNNGFKIKKRFRGMSTKEVQKLMGKTNLKTSEGVTRYRKAEYHLDGWVQNFNHYLRSAMSYTNSKNLDEFIGNCNLISISDNSFKRFNK